MQSCGQGFGSPSAPPQCTSEEIEKNLAIVQLSRWLMGPHWDTLGQEKQDDFIGLLTRLLRELAYPRASEFLADTQFEYGDTQLQGNEALTEVSVVNPDEGRVTIGFRLNQSEGVWKIWDVRLDGSVWRATCANRYNRSCPNSPTKSWWSGCSGQSRTPRPKRPDNSGPLRLSPPLE